MSSLTHAPKSMMMAKDLVAGMSIYDPTPGSFDSPVVLIISTKHEETTRLLEGPTGTAALLEEEKLELLLMENPTTGQCHICRVSPGAIVRLAAPKFVLPPSPRKAEEP